MQVLHDQSSRDYTVINVLFPAVPWNDFNLWDWQLNPVTHTSRWMLFLCSCAVGQCQRTAMRASELFLPQSGKSELFKRSGTICAARNLDICSKTAQKYLTEIKLIYLSLQELDCCSFWSFFPLHSWDKRTLSNTKPCVFQSVAKIFFLAKHSARFPSNNIPFKRLMLLCFGMLPCMAGYYSVLAHTAIHCQTPTTFNRVVWIHNGINNAVLHSASINTKINKLWIILMWWNHFILTYSKSSSHSQNS